MYIYIYTHIYTYIYVYIFGCIKTHVKQLMFLFLCVNAGSELQPKFQRHTKFFCSTDRQASYTLFEVQQQMVVPKQKGSQYQFGVVGSKVI